MTKSTASFAYLAETHQLCARQWTDGEHDCVCNCHCHEQEEPVAGGDVMEFVKAFRQIFLDSLSLPIEAHWDPVYTSRLAGFPVSVRYVNLAGENGPERATYYFDPRTFSEDREERRLRYFAQANCEFWVEVIMRKTDGSIETRKHRGKKLISVSAGPDFRTAMLRAAVSGFDQDEKADEESLIVS